jgi:hypothetical protein
MVEDVFKTPKLAAQMIEVFKTDVNDRDSARRLIDRIHKTFDYCEANFDLDDCDRILRVKGIRSEREVFTILSLVKEQGRYAQILPDDDPSDNHLLLADQQGGVEAKM